MKLKASLILVLKVLTARRSLRKCKHAEDLGVELVPCIQTLAHLAKALRWPAFGHIKDTADILLIDEPKTYEFIEKMIAAMRECFTTNKIHIGMDEAHGVGFGKYFDLHGYKDKFQIMTDHLQRVVEITKIRLPAYDVERYVL